MDHLGSRDTLRSHLRSKLAQRSLAAAAAVVTFSGLSVAYKAGVLEFNVQQEPTSATPPSPRSPAGLIAANDCWQGLAPAGAVAGRVVATLPGHSAPGVYGRRVTARAIEQAVYGVDHGMIVYGFCRAK